MDNIKLGKMKGVLKYGLKSDYIFLCWKASCQKDCVERTQENCERCQRVQAVLKTPDGELLFSEAHNAHFPENIRDKKQKDFLIFRRMAAQSFSGFSKEEVGEMLDEIGEYSDSPNYERAVNMLLIAQNSPDILRET